MRACPEASIGRYRGSATAAIANHPCRNDGVIEMGNTSEEKFVLVRAAAQKIAMAGIYLNGMGKEDVIYTAERIMELAKSIPDSDWPK